jgi:predicted DNA-binding transcriptional regulator AlpA
VVSPGVQRQITRPELTRLIDREQLARKLDLRLEDVVAHAKQRGFPRPVSYYRGRRLWEEAAVDRWLEQRQNT